MSPEQADRLIREVWQHGWNAHKGSHAWPSADPRPTDCHAAHVLFKALTEPNNDT